MTEGETLFSRAFADLRRRKVFRVAAGYGVVAWLVIEVASVVIPALRLPEWMVSAVVITAMAGFPITLLLAWLFDLTPEGVVRTRPVRHGAREVHRVARVIMAHQAILKGTSYTLCLPLKVAWKC